MTEEAIEINAPDGAVDAYYYVSAAGSGPGVIFLTDIRGVREATRQMAARIAQDGYSVLLPNVFYRTRRPPAFDFPFVFGEERTMQRFAALTTPLTPEACARDADAFSRALLKMPGVQQGKIGVLGHCFTGPIALRYAAECPERVAAAVSFHGGHIVTDAPTSPHLVLPRVRASLYFAHAQNDGLMPGDRIATLEQALAAWGGNYESETYAGARHGWTALDAPVYNKELAERARAKMLDLFARTLR